MTNEVIPPHHALWSNYSPQALELACKENRLEELLAELFTEILNNPSVSNETKFETGCRAICMIPAEQSELIKKISGAFKTMGLWKLSKKNGNSFHQILCQAQDQAVKQRNFPAALKLVSKASYPADESLIYNVLDFLPQKELVECVARKTHSVFSIWIREVSAFSTDPEGYKSLFNAGGYRFLDPKKYDYLKYPEFLDLLKPYVGQRHNNLSLATRALMAPFGEESEWVEDIAAILEAFSLIPDDQHPECIQAVLILSYDGLSGADRAALIKAVVDLPIGRRVKLCQVADELNQRSVHVRKFRSSLEKKPRIREFPSSVGRFLDEKFRRQLNYGLSWGSILQTYREIFSGYKLEQTDLRFKKAEVEFASKTTPDLYSVKRVIAILKKLSQLNESSFSENISKIKLHVDAHQLIHQGQLKTEDVCQLIDSAANGIFAPTEMSKALSEFVEPERELLIRKYWEHFGDIPVGDRNIRHFFCNGPQHFHFEAKA